jgi:hypothetical protein
MSMFVFSMQHGMLWVGNPILPEQHTGVPYDEAANRLGSWSGLMAQAGHSAPADSFAPGDLKTARLFGRHVANSLIPLLSDRYAAMRTCRCGRRVIPRTATWKMGPTQTQRQAEKVGSCGTSSSGRSCRRER